MVDPLRKFRQEFITRVNKFVSKIMGQSYLF